MGHHAAVPPLPFGGSTGWQRREPAHSRTATSKKGKANKSAKVSVCKTVFYAVTIYFL